MGRRNAFGPLVGAITRAAKAAERDRQRQIRQKNAHARYEQSERDRAEKQYWQQTQQEFRELERQERQDERDRARVAREKQVEEKAIQKAYVEKRHKETDDLNIGLGDQLQKLSSVLSTAFKQDHRLDIESLKTRIPYKDFEYPAKLDSSLSPAPPSIQPLSFLRKLIPGAVRRHQRTLHEADTRHAQSINDYEQKESEKKQLLDQLYANHLKKKEAYEQKIQRYNASLNDLQAGYVKKEPHAVVAYCEHVFRISMGDTSIQPQGARIAYSSESGELVVEQELPVIDIVPNATEYRYVKSRDDIDSKPRKPAEIKEIYADFISALALRTLYVLFQADAADGLKLITFNGVLNTHSRATGRPERVPVISVRATKEEFETLDLRRVDKRLCLRQLGAHVSSHPDELLAVKPIMYFDMVDKRFVDQSNLLEDLNSRPNLMDLTPTEFEILVANLFGRMGLESKLTRSTRDGGVDAIAFDSRPILGGKVVIQAKRYSNTVGVSAVRDLYGTMLNEGANKGILVSTSGYGPDAYNFSKDKPIELIDGQGLLYLLREHANTDARIVFDKP